MCIDTASRYFVCPFRSHGKQSLTLKKVVEAVFYVSCHGKVLRHFLCDVCLQVSIYLTFLLIYAAGTQTEKDCNGQEAD